MSKHILLTKLKNHIEKVSVIHQKDLSEGWGRVDLPFALSKKYPKASGEFKWQFLFQQKNRWVNKFTKGEGIWKLVQIDGFSGILDCFN